VAVWNVAAAKQVVSYTGQTGAGARLAWSPDGTRIAAANYDGTVHIFDAATGIHILTYGDQKEPVWSVAWSPDGSKLVSGTGAAGVNRPVGVNNSVKVWDSTTGKTLLTYSGYASDTNIYTVAWSRDGTQIISGGDDKLVRIWDAVTGQTRLLYRGHTNVIWTAEWSPDGTLVASCAQDATVQVWRPQAG
jgi:WD40 repeat protein